MTSREERDETPPASCYFVFVIFFAFCIIIYTHSLPNDFDHSSHNFSNASVCDPENMINDDYHKGLMERYIKQTEHNYSVRYGSGDKGEPITLKMVVVLINELDEGIPFYINDKKCQYIADTLRTSWDDDKSEDRDRIIVLMSQREMSTCISCSKNLRKIITEPRKDEIIQQMEKRDWWNQNDIISKITFCMQRISYFLDEGCPSFFDNYGWFTICVLFSLFQCCIKKYVSRASNTKGKDQLRELSEEENEEAISLMKRYQCYSCPICLEDYQENELSCLESMEEGRLNIETNYGSLPKTEYFGSDGEPIQLLRCGHSSCRRCWDEWISHGKNSTECPVCKKDIGG